MQADEAFFKLLRLGIGTCHDRDVALDKAGWAAVLRHGVQTGCGCHCVGWRGAFVHHSKAPDGCRDALDRISAANRNPQPQAQPDGRNGV